MDKKTRNGLVIMAGILLIASTALIGVVIANNTGGGQASSSLPEINYVQYKFSIARLNNETAIKPFNDKDCLEPVSKDVSPFNTDISVQYYLDKGSPRLKEFEKEANAFFSYRHALYDRHNYYASTTENGELVKINNLKDLNDSYGTGESLVIDPLLYDGLKECLSFAEVSEGKFSIGIGNLSTAWDNMIALSNDYFGNPIAANEYNAISLMEQRVIYEDILPEELDFALNTTPSLDELKTALVFDDENHSVTFNSIPRIDSYVNDHLDRMNIYKREGRDYTSPSLTLSAFAKGEATQEFVENYPDRIMLVNSGSSSIKCQGSKQNDTPWEITLANPLYRQAARAGAGSQCKMNYADVAFILEGSFNLSTSGYYNNYYYTDNGRVLRSHIVDPSTGVSHDYFASVSLLLDDSGYADMYTTTLMNCDSMDEALDLLGKLDEFTGNKSEGIFLVNDKYPSRKVTCYVSKELKDDVFQLHDKYPDLFEEKSVTEIKVY